MQPIGDATVLDDYHQMNSIILEYLQLNGFDESARQFEEDIAEAVSIPHLKNILEEPLNSQTPIQQANQNIIQLIDQKNELLSLYDDGNRDDFFVKLDEFLDSNSNQDGTVNDNADDNGNGKDKLEFSLQVHFVVYGLRQSKIGTTDDNVGAVTEIDDVLMQKFKTYLKTRSGSSLTNDPDYLPYFALPYIANPRQHFSFKELFEETWIDDLRQRLNSYLNGFIKKSEKKNISIKCNLKTSRLMTMYAQNQGIKEISAQLQWERQKLLRLQDNYQKLMQITTELLSALEVSVKGGDINLSQVMDNCLQAFPELFAGGAHVDLTSGPNPDVIMNKLRSNDQNQATTSSKSVYVEPERKSTPLLRSKTQAMLLVSLDYRSIKRDLIESPPRLKMFILQALRWRLTKCESSEQRQSVLASYVAFDMLGTEGGDYADAIGALVTSQTMELRQSMARLLNAFASLTAGRSYLAAYSGGNRLLNAIMDNVRYNKPEAVTLDMSLSTLQKLSLRRHLQTIMINGDLIEYLVSVLEDEEALSDYALEYTVALLMNLCLRTLGKDRCARCPRRVLSILTNLLGNQNPEIIPYVNGTLYSLLTVNKIKREALSMGLEDMLNCYMEDSSPEMGRQLEFILKQLASDDPVEETISDYEDEDDDDEEQDVLEEELDKDDVVLVIPGELQGEALLAENYSLHALKQRQKEKQEEVLTRPATPRVQPASSVRRRSSVLSWTGRRSSSSMDEIPTELHFNKEPSIDHLQVKSPNERRSSITQQALVKPQTPLTPTTNLNVDQYASKILNEVVGIEKPVTEAVGFPPVLPREPEKFGGTSVNEYVVAFSSRPKIPRTPEHSGRRSQSPYFDRQSYREGL